MTSWTGDRALRNLFKNASVLLSGDLGAAALGLAAMALTARGLGAETFGILVLIQSYALVVDRLINFQSWQALIKYGADALERGERTEFERLVKFCALLDAASAMIGTLVALVCVPLAADWLGWSPADLRLAWLYSFIILFNLSGTPTGILRLFDRYGALAGYRLLGAVLKLAGVVLCYLAGAGLAAYLGVWLVSEVVGYLYLLGMGWLEVRRQGFQSVGRAEVRGITSKHVGIWHFVWTTNLNGSVRMSSRQLDELVVGGVLSSTAVGLYKVAKQFATVLARLSEPLYQAIYPELARLWASGAVSDFKRLGWRAALMAGLATTVVWLVFPFFGPTILAITVGTDYLGAQPVLVIYSLAILLSVFTLPLQPAVVAMGRPGMSFWIALLSTIIYFGALVFGVDSVGLIGAGYAYLLYYGVWALGLGGVVWYLVRGTSRDHLPRLH